MPNEKVISSWDEIDDVKSVSSWDEIENIKPVKKKDVPAPKLKSGSEATISSNGQSKSTSASTIVSKPNPNNQTSFTVSKENSFGIPNFQIPGVSGVQQQSTGNFSLNRNVSTKPTPKDVLGKGIVVPKTIPNTTINEYQVDITDKSKDATKTQVKQQAQIQNDVDTGVLEQRNKSTYQGASKNFKDKATEIAGGDLIEYSKVLGVDDDMLSRVDDNDKQIYQTNEQLKNLYANLDIYNTRGDVNNAKQIQKSIDKAEKVNAELMLKRNSQLDAEILKMQKQLASGMKTVTKEISSPQQTIYGQTPGGNEVSIVAMSDDEKTAIKSQIESLKKRKGAFLQDTENPQEVFQSLQPKITMYEKQNIIPKDASSLDKMRIYYGIKLTQLKELKKQSESENSSVFIQQNPILKALGIDTKKIGTQVVNSIKQRLPFVDDKTIKSIQEIEGELNAIAPILANNLSPNTKKSGFWKTAKNEFIDALSATTTNNTSQDNARFIQKATQEAGVNLTEDRQKELALQQKGKDYAQNNESFGQMIGNTAEFALEFGVTSVLGEGLINYGAKLLKVTLPAKAYVGVNMANNALRETKLGNLVLGATDEAIKYEVAGALNKQLKDDATASQGAIGFLGSELGEKFAKPIATLFGANGGKFVLLLGDTFGRTVVELFEETGQNTAQLVNQVSGDDSFITGVYDLFKDSEKGKEFISKLKENYSDADENVQFVASIFAMSFAFNAGKFGKFFTDLALKKKEELSETDKEKVDVIIDDLSNEYTQAQQKAVEETAKAQGKTEEEVLKDIEQATAVNIRTEDFGAEAKKDAKIESAVIEIGGKIYEGKNHAEAILKAKADGQDISQVNRQAEGKFKLSDGTIIDRAESKTRFGQDRSELIIPQDEAAKQANKDYAEITKGLKNEQINQNVTKQQDNGDSTGMAGSEQNGEAIRAKSEQGKLSNEDEIQQNTTTTEVQKQITEVEKIISELEDNPNSPFHKLVNLDEQKQKLSELQKKEAEVKKESAQPVLPETKAQKAANPRLSALPKKKAVPTEKVEEKVDNVEIKKLQEEIDSFDDEYNRLVDAVNKEDRKLNTPKSENEIKLNQLQDKINALIDKRNKLQEQQTPIQQSGEVGSGVVDVEGFVGGTKIYRAGGKGRYFTTDKQYIQEGGFKGETREFEIPKNTKLLDLREEDYKGILDLATEEEKNILIKPQAKNSAESKEQGNIVDGILKRNGYDGYIIKDAGETKDFDTVVFRKDKSPDIQAVEQSLKEQPKAEPQKKVEQVSVTQKNKQPTVPKMETTENPALKDVESTTKALDELPKDNLEFISRKENNRRKSGFYEKAKGVLFKGFGGNASVISDKFGSKYKYFTDNPDYAKSFSLEKEYLTQKGKVEKYQTDYKREYNTNEKHYNEEVLNHSGKKSYIDLTSKDYDNFNDKLKDDGYDVVNIKRTEPLIPSESYRGHSANIRNVEVEEHLILNDNSIKKISDQPILLKNNSKTISEAYHKAKADGSNPELVKAVEDALKPTPEVSKPVSEVAELKEKQQEAQSKFVPIPLQGKYLIGDALDRIADKIGSKKNLTQKEKTSLIKDVTDLAKGLIQEGKATLDNVIDKIKEAIKKRFPDLDENDLNDISENIKQKVVFDEAFQWYKDNDYTYEEAKKELDDNDVDYNEKDLKAIFAEKKEADEKKLDSSKQRVADRFVKGNNDFENVRQFVINEGYDKGDYDSKQIFKDIDNLIEKAGTENIEQLLDLPLSEPHRVVLQSKIFEHFGKQSTDENLSEEERQIAFEKSARYLLDYSRQRTEAGRGNAILNQIYLDSDIYFTLPMMMKKMDALGTILSDTEMAEIDKMSKEIEQLRKENKELQELAKKDEEQQTIEDIKTHLLVDELIISSQQKDDVDVQKAKTRLGKNFQKIAEKFGSIKMLEATEKANFFEILHEMTKDLMTISKVNAKKSVRTVIKSIKQQHSNIDDKLLNEAQEYILGQEKEETEIEDSKGNKITKGDLLELIEDGANTMDKMVEAIREKYHGGDKTVTDKQIRDSITNYGNSIKKDKTDVEKTLSEIKSLMLLQSKLEDALQNVPPKKTGTIREKDTIAVIQLRRELAEAMKKLTTNISENEIAGLNERKLTYLSNRIKEVQEVINGLNKKINTKAPFEYNEAVKEKQKELDDLMKQQDVLLHFTKEKLTNLIEKYQKKIDNKIYSKNPILTKLSITDAEHQKLKKTLEEKKRQLKNERETFKQTDANTIWNKMQKNTDRQIERLDELLKGIDRRKTSWVSEQVKRYNNNIIDNALDVPKLAMLRLNQQRLEAKKEEWEKKIIRKEIEAELANKSKLRRLAGSVINNLISLSRTATLGLIDVGWIGVQGGYFMRTAPFRFKEALQTAYTNGDLDEKSFNEWRKNLKDIPLYEKMLKSGLRIPSQSLREELFEQEYRESAFTNFLEKLPIAKLVNKNGRLSVKFLAHLRMEVFNEMYNKLSAWEKQDQKTLEKLADFVNIHSGAGGVIGESKNGSLNKAWSLLTSARNTSSMLQQTYLGMIYQVAKNYDHRKPLKDQSILFQQVKNDVINQLVLFSSLFLAQAIAKYADDDDEKMKDWEIEYSPFSTDFLKLKGNGKKYFDMGGTTSLNVATLRLATMMLNVFGADIDNYKTKFGYSQIGGSQWNDKSGLDILGESSMNRLAPFLSPFKNALIAKRDNNGNYNMFGEEYTPNQFRLKLLLDMLAPINAGSVVGDITDEKQNAIQTVGNFLINSTGVGVQDNKNKTGKGNSRGTTRGTDSRGSDSRTTTR